MRRYLRVLAVAAWSLALALSPAVPGTDGAAEPGATLDAYGWWNKSQALPVQGDPTGLGLTTVPTVPAPPTVPEDGLSVANDASGAAAIAAVRYRLDGQAGGTLTLHLADGSTLTGTEEIVACPIQGGFEAAQNGRWDAKPGYDEAACVIPAEPNDAGDALTFAVPATMASVLGDIAVAIVPAPGSTTPFTLGFTKPADADFVVTTQVTSAAPTVTAAPAHTPGSPVYTAPGTQSPSFSTPSTPAIASPPAAGDDEAAPSVPTGPTLATEVADEESRAPRIVAILALMAVGAGLWWLGSQPQRAPRLLGSVGGKAAAVAPAAAAATTVSRPRGVGRFARPRTAPATRL